MKMSFSDRSRHFFHVVSNVRPLVWICVYLALMPLFAFFYQLLPDWQFRIPDGGGTTYGSWLYYSIVTITTLGFGDYTPAHGGAQALTAIEVMCGMLTIGFFLNAVGSMKSEIDVISEKEKQRRVHEALESDKLLKNIPVLLHKMNLFLAWCWAVTTPADKRKTNILEFNANFTFSDMHDLFKPSYLPVDYAHRPAVEGLLQCAGHVSLNLDSLQQRIDLTLWEQLLEDCFAFVSNVQLFSSSDNLHHLLDMVSHKQGISIDDAEHKLAQAMTTYSTPEQAEDEPFLRPVVELYHFIKDSSEVATRVILFLNNFSANHSATKEAKTLLDASQA